MSNEEEKEELGYHYLEDFISQLTSETEIIEWVSPERLTFSPYVYYHCGKKAAKIEWFIVSPILYISLNKLK